jgi:iron complex outermembrane receptor protein
MRMAMPARSRIVHVHSAPSIPRTRFSRGTTDRDLAARRDTEISSNGFCGGPFREPSMHIPQALCQTACLVAIPLASTVSAQTREDAESPLLPELVIQGSKNEGVPNVSQAATKNATPLIKTPQSVSVVSRAEVETRGAQSVSQAIGYVPGLIIGQGGEDSRVDELLIRGFDAGGFSNNVYLDGLRIPAGGQWTRYQGELFGLETMEVLKGPSGVLFGQVAPGGLINLTSKRPTADEVRFASLQYGSFETFQFAFDHSGAIGSNPDYLYRIVGLYRDGGSQIQHTDLERLYLAPSFTWKMNEATSITILASHQEDRGGATYQFLPVNGSLYRTPLGTIDRDEFIGEPSHNRFDRDQSNIGIEWSHRIHQDLTFEQNIRYAEIRTHYDGVVAGRTLPDAAGNMSRRAVTGIGDAHNLTLDSRLKLELETGPLAHTAMLGFDYIRSSWQHERTGTNNVPTINIFDPVYTGITAPFALQVSQDVIEHQKGFYLQDQINWDQWHLTIGGRYDDTEIDLLNVMDSTRTKTRASEFTGRAGLLYAFDSGVAPYASYSTSFEPVSGTARDGRAFNPTEGEQFEVGVKYQPKSFDALFTIAAFDLTQTNVLTLDPADPTFQTQTGEVAIGGVEVEAKIALWKGFSLVGGFALTDSEISRSNDGNRGNAFAGVPGESGSLWLDYEFREGALAGLGIGAGARYVGPRHGDLANQYSLPSYTLIDAAIRYDLGGLSSRLEGARISLSAMNLADKCYVAKAETASSANYGPGRLINVNLSYTW